MIVWGMTRPEGRNGLGLCVQMHLLLSLPASVSWSGNMCVRLRLS